MESPVAKRPRGRPPKARAVPIEFRPTPPASVKEGEVVAYLDLQDGGLKVKLTKNGTLYTGLLPLVLEFIASQGRLHALASQLRAQYDEQMQKQAEVLGN